MTISGIILSIAGVVSLILGIVKNNNVESQLESIFENGVANPGTPFIIVGAIAAVIGIVLVIAGMSKKK